MVFLLLFFCEHRLVAHFWRESGGGGSVSPDPGCCWCSGLRDAAAAAGWISWSAVGSHRLLHCSTWLQSPLNVSPHVSALPAAGRGGDRPPRPPVQTQRRNNMCSCARGGVTRVVGRIRRESSVLYCTLASYRLGWEMNLDVSMLKFACCCDKQSQEFKPCLSIVYPIA